MPSEVETMFTARKPAHGLGVMTPDALSSGAYSSSRIRLDSKH